MSEAEVTQQYARIITNHSEMSDVLDKIRMHGKDTDGQTISLVKDVILTFEDGHVYAKAFDPMKSVWMRLSAPFNGIKREGTLVIGDIAEFTSYLSRFGEKTVVEQGVPEEGDAVHLMFNDEDRKRGGFPAQEEEHIKSQEDVDALPFEFNPDAEDAPGDVIPEAPSAGIYLDTWFRCNVREIKDVLEDGDTTEVRTYPMSVDDGQVLVRVGDENGHIETSFKADDGEGTAASVYGYGMDNVFSNLSGDVTVYFNHDSAMWVHQDDEGWQLDYMIAEGED